MDEFDIIARYFAPLAGEGALGLKDDAALVPLRAGQELVVTTDALSESVDFFAFDPPDSIARKALRMNLSDLAAKGAQPAYYLVSLTLPRSTTDAWLAAFARGLADDQQTFGVSLLGGDTGATDGALVIAVTAFGFVAHGQMIKRSGARAGDAIYVTGTIGDSGGGLAILKDAKQDLDAEQRDHLIGRYRVPNPPVDFATTLVGRASAAIDVSDGLIADLGHLASASRARLVVDGETVPLSQPLRALWGEDALLRAVTAGDDYQIAFTGPPGLQGPFTRIGRVEAGEGVCLTIAGRELAIAKSGYRHF